MQAFHEHPDGNGHGLVHQPSRWPYHLLPVGVAVRERETPQPRGQAGGDRPAKERARPTRYDFVVELKDLIAVPNIAERLRRPVKSDKVLGPRKDSWCEFHEAFGHHINNCLSMGYQLDELVKSGFLKDYLAEPATTLDLPALAEDQAHEMPVHDEVHTISGGFFGGGPTASQRKKYVRVVNSIDEKISGDLWESDLVFTRADLRDVVPHDNDPVVISVVTAGRKVHRVLVDQESSANVMFWSTFNKMSLPPDQVSYLELQQLYLRAILMFYSPFYSFSLYPRFFPNLV